MIERIGRGRSSWDDPPYACCTLRCYNARIRTFAVAYANPTGAPLSSLSCSVVMTHSNKRVAIVGGGISGLAAALRILDQASDVQVTLIEATDRWGGVLQTEQVDGYCLELGPDSLLSRLPWGIELCRRVGLGEEMINTSPAKRGVHVVCRGRLQRVPDGLSIMAPQRIWPFVTTPVLSWRAKCRLALEPFLPRRTSTEEETLASFSRRRLGREFYDRLVQPLAGGIYMGDPECLSVQATFPQFAQMEQQHGSLARAARADLKRAAHTPAQDSGGPAYSMFVAPRLGMRQLVDAMTQQLVARHAHLLPNHRVTSLRTTESGPWEMEMTNASTDAVQPAEFDGVVLALTARQAAAVVGRVSEPLSHRLRGLPYEGCVVVNLGYDRSAIPRPLDSFGFVTPYVENLNILACTFTSVKYDGRAPADKTLLRLYLGGARKADALQWTDDRVLQTVQKELRQLLGISAQPELVRIHRWRDSMPQYYVGHEANVAEIEAEVAKLPGLELTGNAYHGVGIPHCVRGGEQAADRLLSYMEQASLAPKI